MLSYLWDGCNKGRGMCCPIFAMVVIRVVVCAVLSVGWL